MQNRTEILKEYTNLINKLNKSNRKANESTELSFFIKSDPASQQNFLWITVNDEKGLVMAKIRHRRFQIVGDFEFPEFASYVIKWLNQHLDDDINLTVRRAISGLFAVNEQIN